MELWLRPPTTAISVLKFCNWSSFWGGEADKEGQGNESLDKAQDLAGEEAVGERKGGTCPPGALGARERGRGKHLSHVDKVRDDQRPLRGRGLAEDHQLHPLRDTVEEGDESLQDRVVHGAAVSHETVIVLELGAGVASAPLGPSPHGWPLLTL